MNLLYYMTQYASYMTDEGYYESMKEQLEELDNELLKELMEIAPYVSDTYNKVLFDLLYHVDDSDLEMLIEIWEYLKDDDIDSIIKLLGMELYELTNGEEIYTYDELEDLADTDFRNNGINASAAYWYNELVSNSGYSFYVFNGYMNGFYTYDDSTELISQDALKKAILDYISKE